VPCGILGVFVQFVLFAEFVQSVNSNVSSFVNCTVRLANGYGVPRSGLGLGQGRTDLGWG
jgi:hypothetical protein